MRKWDQANKTASIMSQSMIVADSILPDDREPETAIIRELETKIGGGDITFE